MNKLLELELSSVLRLGLTYEKISDYDILCLPENLDVAKNTEELFDASDSITLSKLLKNEGITCANSFDLNLDAHVLERRSLEKWFGTVYIRNNVIIPVFVGVLSTLIATEILEGEKADTEVSPKVHIELKIEKQNNITTIKYDGDPNTLLKILNNIDTEDTGQNND